MSALCCHVGVPDHSFKMTLAKESRKSVWPSRLPIHVYARCVLYPPPVGTGRQGKYQPNRHVVNGYAKGKEEKQPFLFFCTPLVYFYFPFFAAFRSVPKLFVLLAGWRCHPSGAQQYLYFFSYCSRFKFWKSLLLVPGYICRTTPYHAPQSQKEPMWEALSTNLTGAHPPATRKLGKEKHNYRSTLHERALRNGWREGNRTITSVILWKEFCIYRYPKLKKAWCAYPCSKTNLI